MVETVPIEVGVSSQWMERERIAVDKRDKKLDLQDKCGSAYLWAFVIPKNHRASVCCTVEDTTFLSGVVCAIENHSLFCYILPKSQNLELFRPVKKYRVLYMDSVFC